MAMLITNQTDQGYWFGPLHLAAGVGQTLTVDDTSATSLYLTDDGVADAINTLYASNMIQVTGAALPFPRPTGTPQMLHGDGSPEGIVYAGQGSIYLRRDNTGGAQFYQKTTGIHVNTGWAAFAGAAVLTPTGAMHAYGGATAPAGWLMCDGSAVSRTTYADLFGVIQTTFGAGDGSSTFNLPDCRGRVIVTKGTHTDVAALGNNDGVVLANRRPKHQHTPHTHGVSQADHGLYAPGSGDGNWGSGTNLRGNVTTSLGSADGGSGNTNDPLDAPAYIVLNYIIKT